MKHLKEIIFEKKDFKSYKKYIPIINDMFKNIVPLELEKTSIYNEFDQIIISFKIWSIIEKKFIIACLNKFGDVNYKILPNSGYQMTIEFYNIPKSFLEELDIIASQSKYNL